MLQLKSNTAPPAYRGRCPSLQEMRPHPTCFDTATHYSPTQCVAGLSIRRSILLSLIKLIHAAFHRLGRISSYLSGECAHFLSLSCHRVELFAPIVRLQFHGLSQVLGTGETLREIKAGIDVALGDVDDLPVEGYRSLISRIEGSLPALHYVFQRILGALIGFSHLSDVPFGEIAHCLRYLSVSC